ncbi:MarR family transcriptional regulator [Nonomuraea sp. NPDC049758]|uniref:MarR family winged helix-turn-helix transcriptional regulator n=1 Tax=Nonomuraea sp. NPDC049758 TaxID=3154360 RepID=UPI00342931EF
MSTEPLRGTPSEHKVPWLSPDQQRDWRAVIALIMTLPPALDAQLKRDAGVNSFEYHVLAALSEAPNRTLVLSNLAALAQGSLSRISHAVTRLERSGWVERHSLPNRGGRHTEARLTDAGFAKLKEIAPGHVREARRLVVDALTPEQLAALGDAARAITAVTMAEAPETCRESGDC